MSNPTFNGYELRPLPDGRTSKVRDRFWPKVDRTPGHGPKGECWLWMGALSDNGSGQAYGKVGWKDKVPKNAHVVSYYLTRGEWPPKGLEVCHTCDNPPCVNPDHLWLGTHRQNMNDAQAKGRLPVAPPPPLKERRIRFRTAQLVKIHTIRKAARLSIYEVGILIGLDYTGYYKFECGDRPSLTVGQFEVLKDVLGLTGLKISDSQYYERGHPGIKTGKKGADPIASAQKRGARLFRPHGAWLKLPPAYCGLYRADLIRAALLRAGAKMCEVTKAVGVDHYAFKDVLNGINTSREDVLRVASYAGLSESEVFNVQMERAA